MTTPLSAAALVERLSSLYGRPRLVPSGDPVAELVLTILSQNTSDRNSGRAFVRLLRRYRSWEEVLAAPTDELAATIAPGGLANQKAPRIQAALRAIAARASDWSLSFLRDLSVEEARAWLRSLPGVGPKTAACVLLFALGMPAMPVDTHVERVAKRLGLVPAKATTETVHQLLEAWVEPSLYYPFHMCLIKHGRRTCTARNPRCDACPLTDVCPSARPVSAS